MKPQTVELVKTGAFVGLGLYTLKKISDYFSQTGGKSPEEKTKDIDNIQLDESKLSFLLPVYDRIADQQFWAMNQAGTDEDTLFESLKDLTDEDLKAVYKAFGVRKPTTGQYTDFAYGTPSDLMSWYIAELSDSIFGKDLTRMRNIWTNTGLWL